MRPIPIGDDEFAWFADQQNPRKKVYSAPDGDLTNPDIHPVEMVEHDSDLGTLYSVVVALEGDDLEILNRGGKIVLTMIGSVPPFDLQVCVTGD